MQVEQDHIEKARIEKVINEYIEALTQSRPDASAAMFTDDGVLMAADAPTMQGTQQLSGFFSQMFQIIKISATIIFDETVVSGAYAFVHTHSEVKIKMLATGDIVDEKNRELFVLKNDNGSWKIVRYMFNKTPV